MNIFKRRKKKKDKFGYYWSDYSNSSYASENFGNELDI